MISQITRSNSRQVKDLKLNMVAVALAVDVSISGSDRWMTLGTLVLGVRCAPAGAAAT